MTSDVLTVLPLDSAGIPDEIDRMLGAAQREVWRLPRAYFAPRIHILEQGGVPAAAVLTSARPHTAYRKVVDVWATELDQVAALLSEVLRQADLDGLAAVKLEAHPWSSWWATGPDSPLAGLGFTPLRPPIVSSAGTDGGVAGFVRWASPWPHDEPVYYGQTTEFTCGAVAALVALDGFGLALFDADGVQEENRNTEFSLWRQATNFPACEPVGLGVATIETLRAAGVGVDVEIHLSTEQPVLLDTRVPGGDGGFRAMLQAESRKRAAELGRPVITDWMSIGDVVAQIETGAAVLLLIDERPMMDDEVPHWVVAHSAHGRFVLLQDPWIDAEDGETWVDAHELPVDRDDLDLMTTYEDPAVRGAIVLTPNGSR